MSSNRSATIASMNAAQDGRNAAAAAPPAPRDWSQGGRIRHVLSSIPLATLLLMLANLGVFLYELSDDFAVGDNSICVAPVLWGHQYSRVFSNAYFHLGFMHIGEVQANRGVGSEFERSEVLGRRATRRTAVHRLTRCHCGRRAVCQA